MNEVPRRVVKLGGSLLGLEDLVNRWQSWLNRQPPAQNLLIVGGGAAVDQIRHLHARHELSDSEAHWLAIQMMAREAEGLGKRLENAAFCPGLAAVPAPRPNQPLYVMDPWIFVHEEDRKLSCSGGTLIEPLPESWDVTSDSIAARLAVRSQAAELVCLKSRLPDYPYSIQNNVTTGYLDQYFWQAAQGIAILRCVALRDPSQGEIFLTT